MAERTFCGTNVYTFTIYNDSPSTQIVDIGLITFNVPPTWQVTTIPTSTMELGPFSEGVVTVIVKIPCPSTPVDSLDGRARSTLQEESGSVPTVDVEGYIDGSLVGGIELQFKGDVEWPEEVYLPVILRAY